MMAPKSMWLALRATRWEHWKDSLLLTSFSLVGGLAPVWIGLLLVVGYGGEADITRFASGGEFALYSAAALAPTIYLIVSERPSHRFIGQPVYTLVALVGILLAVAGYALVAPVAVGLVPYAGLKVRQIASATIGLYAFAVLFSFLVLALDNARTHPPVREIVRDQQEALERDFDGLDGRQ